MGSEEFSQRRAGLQVLGPGAVVVVPQEFARQSLYVSHPAPEKSGTGRGHALTPGGPLQTHRTMPGLRTCVGYTTEMSVDEKVALVEKLRAMGAVRIEAEGMVVEFSGPFHLLDSRAPQWPPQEEPSEEEADLSFERDQYWSAS